MDISHFTWNRLSSLYAIFFILLCGNFTGLSASSISEIQRYDGWYNNLAHSEWGAVGQRLHRHVPSAYSDGVYMMDETTLPSARSISELVFKGRDGVPNQRNLTSMFAFFSQVVAYEIMHSSEASCPIEMSKIGIEACDRVYDPQCTGKTMMPFFRAKYDKKTGQAFNSPREQTNGQTSWIDGSFIYSTSEPWVHMIRSFSNGTLKEGNMPDYPPRNVERLPLINPPPPHVHKLMNPERLFLLGDPRVNENPGLLSFGLMFYRWHNRKAQELQEAHPNWTDNELFNRARQLVIATLQNIIMYEFLPAFLNEPVRAYSGYDPDTSPGISHLFGAAAFRYPHSLIPSGMFLRNGQCRYRKNVGGFPAIRLCNTWWNAEEVINQFSMDEVVLGMASQVAEADDSVIVSDMRDFLFGPMHFSRRDLSALTIMRGRDNGLPDYNTVRTALHLPARNWTEINPADRLTRPWVYERLIKLYENDISKLDFYVGGMLESSAYGPGDVFKVIIREQFNRLRNGDRFWFENVHNEMFTEKEISEIKKVTLNDVILATTNIIPDQIQRGVFFWKEGDPCGQPYQLNSSVLEACIPFMRYDHFRGNEIAFIFACVIMAVIPIIAAGIGYYMIRHRHKKFADIVATNWLVPKADQRLNNLESHYAVPSETLDDSTKRKTTIASNRNSLDFDCALSEDIKAITERKWRASAIEWLHQDYSRSVLVSVCADGTLLLEKRRGGVLRTVNLLDVQTLVVTVSREPEKAAAPTVLLMIPNEYDIVLIFESASLSGTFLRQLERMMAFYLRTVRVVYAGVEAILASAETQEKRQKKLAHFFRQAYAKVFAVSEMENPSEFAFLYGHEQRPNSLSVDVLNTMLSRTEFADALGMHEDDPFVQRMFACLAKRHPDRICFQEFLEMVVTFSNGNEEEKLNLVFDMCDRQHLGTVDRREFCCLMRSIAKTAGSELTDSQHDELIYCVMESCGISRAQGTLTRKHFEAMFQQMQRKNSKHMGLHLKGRRQTYLTNGAEGESVNSFAVKPTPLKPGLVSWINQTRSFLEDYRQHVAWLVVYFTLSFAFFMWKFWHYSQMSEHRDLRRVMGLGIAFTRGAAAALSFSYSLLLLTVCKNVMTLLRSTWVNQYVPFDAAITFHKIIAVTGLVFTAIHTVGHCINFYHISTQSQDGLKCLFQEAVFSSDFQPSVIYWFTRTVTGVTGVLLVIVMSIMYVFAVPSIIDKAYHAFRVTHFMHVLVYGLSVAHGLPKLLDKPSFWCYLLGPLLVFIIDRIIEARRKHRNLQILSTSLLVSDVTFVQFKRPRGFKFRSGQWVNISCPGFDSHFNKWHAFSIASAPQDSTLELYVKAQGPWSWKLRRAIYEAQEGTINYPVLQMSGPYGGGNQDWFNYEVAIMVGGGIGVTPYASMLLDLAHSTSSSKYSDVACKKVYFLWVCPTHKNFEWFIDVLKQVEQLDISDVLEVHIFITQFFHKFDLRTTMLYICEKHFQRVQGRSMFTGLKAINHFGRPNMDIFLQYVQEKHEEQEDIGVFSCGPGTLNQSVRVACEEVNRSRRLPHFTHRYETF